MTINRSRGQHCCKKGGRLGCRWILVATPSARRPTPPQTAESHSDVGPGRRTMHLRPGLSSFMQIHPVQLLFIGVPLSFPSVWGGGRKRRWREEIRLIVIRFYIDSIPPSEYGLHSSSPFPLPFFPLPFCFFRLPRPLFRCFLVLYFPARDGILVTRRDRY